MNLISKHNTYEAYQEISAFERDAFAPAGWAYEGGCWF